MSALSKLSESVSGAEYTSVEVPRYLETRYPWHIRDPSQGHRHISPEYWIYEDRNGNYTVSTNQIMAIPGINSDVGNQVSTVIRFTSP